MAYCQLVLCLLAISVIQLNATQVPVFLWGDLGKISLKSTPLSPVSQDSFNDVLEELIQNDPYVVVFDEETLSVEDFSLKNEDGESSFPYLHANIGKALYLPSVSDPLGVLEDIVKSKQTAHFELTDKALKLDTIPGNARVLFVSLNDANDGDSRADLLRRHNDFMQDLFGKLSKKYGSVVGIYTASNPSWTIIESHSRVRRQALGNSNDNKYFKTGNLLMNVSSIDVEVGGAKVNLTAYQEISTSLNNTELNTTLDFNDTKLTLNFYLKDGYWYFKSVTLSQTAPIPFTEELLPTAEIYSLESFSYTCGEGITYKSVNETQEASVSFTDIKVQPFFTTRNLTDVQYDEAFDCVGYFSVPIWSGLFVVLVMLFITSTGIMMMLDIRTNDRYDDPKSKTITINAGE